MRGFRELKVWAKAHELALAVYRATAGFPREEVYGLTSQTRRSATSIPTNIAEGCGRSGDRDFARFLDMAAGSASELEYQLLLSRDLGLLSGEDYVRLAEDVTQVKRMLAAFTEHLRSRGDGHDRLIREGEPETSYLASDA